MSSGVIRAFTVRYLLFSEDQEQENSGFLVVNETKQSILLKDERKVTLKKGEVRGSIAWNDEERYKPGKILALGGCRITFVKEILKEKSNNMQDHSKKNHNTNSKTTMTTLDDAKQPHEPPAAPQSNG